MINLESLRLRTRLFVLSLVVTLGILAIGGFALYQLQHNLLHDRQEKVRNLVESAHAIVASYEAAARSGQSSVEEAKKAAASVIKAMRYEGNEYFWINDLNDRMVMHPIKPELDGKLLDEIRDKNGKQLFVEFNKVVKASGAGFVHYLWPKPGQDAPAPKISYVKGFAPWDWVIGSGIYIDDVDRAVHQQAMIMGSMTLAMLVLLSLISWCITLSILRQIGGEPAYAAEVVSGIAGGDLSSPVRTENANPASLLAAMGGMQHKLTEMFREINRMAGTLSAGAEQVASAAHEIGVASHSQAQSTSSSAASIEQLTVSIGEVSSVVSQTEANSRQTAALAENGATLVKETAHEIDLIAQTVAVSSEQIEALLGRSQEIGGIASVIKEIADQTNLLALNAAIEAARAGEQGRGFAVVADEVRKLAERTANATTEIARMIDAIQSETQTAVTAMAAAKPQVEKGIERARRATAMLDEIHEQALDSLAKVRDVGIATREQVTTATDIACHVEQIASMAEETNVTMENNAAAAHQLETLANDLRRTVAYFHAA